MIEVEGLTKIYGSPHQAPALAGVSFSVGKGEIAGFLGPNGAGKTTAMRILCGLLSPTRGSARIGGAEAGSREARRRIGFLPEAAPVYLDMSVRDYLVHMAALRGVPRKMRAERLEAALDAGKLEEHADTTISRLSKGFRQRVGLAQAVVHDPEVLILDEPSAGLDPRQRAETRRFIQGLGRERTVLLSTHILPDVAQLCERVIVIHRGRIASPNALENTGADTLALTLRRAPRDGEAVGALLRALPGVRDAARTRLGSVGSADVADAARAGQSWSLLLHPSADAGSVGEAVSQAAVERDWGLCEVWPARGSLEETFLSLTRDE
jgi:ABC-2 type transport system ATP-binding protein